MSLKAKDFQTHRLLYQPLLFTVRNTAAFLLSPKSQGFPDRRHTGYLSIREQKIPSRHSPVYADKLPCFRPA